MKIAKMKKKTGASVTADGVDDFFRRAREHARKLDADERALLESVERGEWRPVKPVRSARSRYARYAKAKIKP